MTFSLSRRVGTLLLLLLASPANAGAEGLLARSDAAMRAGNVSLARRLATEAVASHPASGPSHVAAARAALAEGDGITAEGELSRARDAGIDGRSVRHLLAHARLLQGDASGALAAARDADTVHRTYGMRIEARALAMSGDRAGAAAVWSAAIARSPDDADLWTDVGTARSAAGDLGGAVEAAARAVALAPANLDALLLHARLTRTATGLVAALPLYEAALRRDPYSYAALIDYAATLGDVGRATEMLAATRRALAVRPDDPQAFYLLAVMAARAGNTALARAMYDRTGDALDGVPGPLLLGATLALQSGDLEQAAAKLRNLLGLQPMNFQARQLLAVALLRLDAPRDALEVLRPIALRADADSYTLLLSARAFERLGNRGDAAVLIDRAAAPAPGVAAIFAPEDSLVVVAAAGVQRASGDPTTAIPLIRSLLANGDIAGAVARAEAVVAANPGLPEAATVLGDTLIAARRPGPAITAYRRAAALRFDEPVMLRLARALEATHDAAGAAEVIAAFLSQNPANVAAGRLLARGQLGAGDAAGAVDTLERLRARIGNRDAALLTELAAAYDSGDAPRTAASYAAAAYRLAPANAGVAHLYGWSLYRSGQAAASLPMLEKAVRLAPEGAMLRWHIAQVYAHLGRRAEARVQAAMALRDPRFTERAAAGALIAGLA